MTREPDFDVGLLKEENERLRGRVAAMELESCSAGFSGIFSQVVEKSPVMVTVASPEGNILYTNPPCLSSSGYRNEDLLGKPVTIHCADGGQIERLWNAMDELRSGRRWRGRIRKRRKNGTDYWVEASYSPVFAEKGGVSHLLCVEQDITDRIRDEEVIRRNETLLSILFRISNTVQTTRDLNDLYRSIHGILREFVDVTNYYIALVDEARDRMVFPFFYDEKDTDECIIENISDPSTYCLALHVVRTEQPLLIRKNEQDALMGVNVKEGRGVIGTVAECWLGVPLKVGGKTIGAMAVQDYYDPMHYSQNDVDLMQAISEQVAMAIERKRMDEALRVSEQRYRTVSDSAFNLETWRGTDGRMLYVSPSCERITGYPAEKLQRDPDFMEEIIHRDDLPLWRKHVEAGCKGTSTQPVEFRIFRSDGRMHWLSLVSRTVNDDYGNCLGLRCSMHDITESKTMQRELRYANLHDSLTGLSNRSLCLDRIRQTMERSKRRDDHYFAVVYLDIDRFRVINDSMGHSVGDELLREVSERLLKCVRSLDTVSRYGGDEFVIVLDELESPREAIRAAKRVRKLMRQPFIVGTREIHLTVSMGIVLSPVGDVGAEDILQHANIAMHNAVKDGTGRVRVFTARMLEQAVMAMDMEHDLARALERDEFFLNYQPIVRVTDGDLIGFEALVRWNHPQKGVLGPGYFIPFAEESGQIIDLGLVVLREACKTMAGWLQEHPDRPQMQMSVNLSCRQFEQVILVEQISCILEETGLPAANLKLEITESAIMQDAEGALSILRRLKSLGIKLSIDDFGTGYSSLSYLQRFPVDTLKVDRSFISEMGLNGENIAIVRAVVVLAQSMGLDVVAEGVELPEQLAQLRALECQYVQGFYFSKPLDTADARMFIAAS
ncbi:EAL domain-containing protein [Desulfovibrio ferrophilus]|uniref:Diguanylate cyclase/phosphodiesterase with PAS/PAC sensor(S) n=1 Tax=Desulfovibrio ferrophilus TaxID=241368 RepID=A0A2Z6B108_9BACT|nr:EAL domain-containing protein [Desulfovibrio ferrophilus]BBD09191.1 diguanylate cyclase/phosphodiesterase with PAS/PAC sensor(S) [Desulfovibrio ferrophilus]